MHPVGLPHARRIGALSADGAGLAMADAGPALATALTLPGEAVRVQPLSDGRAALLDVMERSPERVEAPCPHFGPCGGCALQHWDRPAYLDWKVGRLRATLRGAGLEAPFDAAYAAAPGERRRVALHARPGPGGAAALGFKGRRSWTVQPIRACVIAAPAIVAALPDLERLAAPFLAVAGAAPTLHVTATLTGLDVDVTGVAAAGLSGDARLQVAQTAAAADLARVTLSGEALYAARIPMVRFDDVPVGLPAGGFLQASGGAERAMAAFAAAACVGAARVADLFCGAGPFAFALARSAEVLAIDASAPAIAALDAARSGAGDRRPVTARARDLFRRPLTPPEMKRLDAVVFDPPRAGALEQARAIAASGVGVCVAVSCNPETFVRDAKALVAAGFALERIKPVDQFLWSPHMEVVGVLRR